MGWIKALIVVVILIILATKYYTHDPYGDLTKNFKGYKTTNSLEQYELHKHSFIIFGPSSSRKTTFMKDYCGLSNIKNSHVFCYDTNEWQGYRTCSFSDLDLLKYIENFADSLILLDATGDSIRLPAVDAFYPRGRHHNTKKMYLGYTKTDTNTKAWDNTQVVDITLNSSNLFIVRVQDKLRLNSQLSRFKHFEYGIIKYNMIDDYYIIYD